MVPNKFPVGNIWYNLWIGFGKLTLVPTKKSKKMKKITIIYDTLSAKYMSFNFHSEFFVSFDI